MAASRATDGHHAVRRKGRGLANFHAFEAAWQNTVRVAELCTCPKP